MVQEMYDFDTLGVECEVVGGVTESLKSIEQKNG